MTTPPHPFAPMIQASTTIYQPHSTVALDLLPPFHGYAFQEKDLQNGILRPHDVYAGEALRIAQDALDAKTRIPPEEEVKGFSFLSIPTTVEETNELGSRGIGADEPSIVYTLPGQKRLAVKPVWKSKTKIPPSTALLGTVGLFRPSLPEREAGLALHRRQRRQQYPPPPAVPTFPSTRAELEDYLDTLRDHVETDPKIERALELLQPSEVFVQQYAMQRERQLHHPELTSSPKPQLRIEVESNTYAKLSDNTHRKEVRRKQKAARQQRALRKPKPSVTTEREDANVSAIKKLFQAMKSGELDQLEESEEVEEESEVSDSDDDVVPFETKSREFQSGLSSSGTVTDSRQLSVGGRGLHSPGQEPAHSTLSQFSPSARTMFDQPQPIFDQVPRGSAKNSNPHGMEDYEMLKHLRWAVYQEEYERTLLCTEEQESNPIPYYGSFVHGAGLPALEERLRHPIQLNDVDKLHRGVDAALNKAIEEVLALEEQRPPKELTPALPPPNPVKAYYDEVLRSKTEMYEQFASLHDQLRERIALFQEEKRARLAVLAQFISCEYPKPCRCLLWDMEILEESNVELEPAVPPTCVLVSMVLSLSRIIQDDLLAKRQTELDEMKETLHCLYFTSYAWDRLMDDERRQWQKIVLYHQYCMQLASRHDVAAREWCRCRGLVTLEEEDDEDTSAQPANHHNGQAKKSSTREKKETLESDRQGRMAPEQRTQNEEKAELPGPRKMELTAMRRSRLQFLGPHDSPFCSYVKFLEVIVTTVLEQDGRQMVIHQEKKAVAGVLQKVCVSFAQASLRTQEREARENIQVYELQEWESLQRDFIEWQAVVPGVQLLEQERFLRQDLLWEDLRKVDFEAQAGAELIMKQCTAEYLDLWRRIHNQLLVLQRAHRTKPEERELVKEWAGEQPRQYVESEQSRHRMKIMTEESNEFELFHRCFTWMKDVCIPARVLLEFRDEAFERRKLMLTTEEDAKRIGLYCKCSTERIALLERIWRTEDDVSRERQLAVVPPLERCRKKKRVPPRIAKDLNIRLQMISNLNYFATSDELAAIFENDNGIQ